MDYTSEDFDIARLVNYRLLIRAGRRLHALAVIDTKNHLQLLSTFSVNDMSKQVTDILSLPFYEVRIATAQNAFTFIPEEVYDENHLDDYASYLPAQQHTDRISITGIPHLGVKNIHIINRLGGSMLIDRFPQAKIYPYVHVLLNSAAVQLTRKRGAAIGIDLYEQSLSLSYFDAGKFVYFNDFEVLNIDDFNFYLLSLINSFNIDIAGLDFFVSGDISHADSFHNCLLKYSEKVTFADIKKLIGVTFPESLADHQHRFLSLLGLNICA